MLRAHRQTSAHYTASMRMEGRLDSVPMARIGHEMDRRPTHFIGYFPKKAAPPDGWFADLDLREFC
jgi:hypothetical protein